MISAVSSSTSPAQMFAIPSPISLIRLSASEAAIAEPTSAAPMIRRVTRRTREARKVRIATVTNSTIWMESTQAPAQNADNR